MRYRRAFGEKVCRGAKTFPGKLRQNRRSLGFARDDKKERVVVKRGPFTKDRSVVWHGGVYINEILSASVLWEIG
jgi:hypothetical protein